MRKALSVLAALALAAAGITPTAAAHAAAPAPLPAGAQRVMTPDGQMVVGVPQAGFHAPKSVPTRGNRTVTSGGVSTLTTTERTYAGVRKTFNSGSPAPTDTGCSTYLTIHAPFVSTADDHSLAECSVQGGTSDGNIVEVGWRKDSASGLVKSFTFAWRVENGVRMPGCYNGCSYYDNTSEAVDIGAALTSVVGQSKMFYIQHFSNVWWIAYDGKWVGYHPDSWWAASPTPQTFDTSSGTISMMQVFGELAGRVYPTICTDMGSNQLPSSSTSARMEKLHVVNGANANDNWTMFLAATGTTTTVSTTHYNIAAFSSTFDPVTYARNFRYGGPGGC